MNRPTNPGKMTPMNTTPDLPEIPQPRRPFDHDRLHKLEIAAESAYAITRALSACRDELRAERGKLTTSIHLAEFPRGRGTHRPGAAAREDYARLAFVEEQLRAVETEFAAHTKKAGPLRACAQACIEWARKQSWTGDNAIGVPECPASEIPTPDTPPATHSAPVTRSGSPSIVTAAPGVSRLDSILSILPPSLTGGRHGHR